MKKYMAILLAFVLVLGLCGCGEKAENAETKPLNLDLDEFSVGYARIDITPANSVPMAGYGATSKRMSQNVIDYLFATSVAINDGQGNTVVFLTVDLQRASDVLVQYIRPELAKQTGLPESAFHMTGTHTHSGPDVQSTNEYAIAYRDMIMPKLVEVVMASLQDLQPATMHIGTIETERMNFVRHYVYENEEGETIYAGDNHNVVQINDTTKHVSEADPTMFVMKFDREDAKDVCLINWRAHPHWTGGISKYDISSDYIGPFRETFELETDCLFAYYQGAAGNINEKSRITAENRVRDNKAYGALLTSYAVKCMNENLKEVPTGAIQVQERTLDLTVNKTTDTGLYYAAKNVQAVFSATADKNMALASAGEYTIYSPYHAAAIVNNYHRGNTEQRTYSVVTIGQEVAITLAPHEMFDSLMATVEENSPYRYTMHFSYSNGSNTYIADEKTWDYGAYETDTAVFVRGTGETIRDTFIHMLKEMHG